MGRSCTEEELCKRDTIEVRYNRISLGERGASQPDDGVTIRGWERLMESAGAHNLHQDRSLVFADVLILCFSRDEIT